MDRLPEMVSVGWKENQVGVRLLISSSGLNAVEIIQKTGKTMIANTSRPTAFQPAARARRDARGPRGRARCGRCRAHVTSPIFTILRT